VLVRAPPRSAAPAWGWPSCAGWSRERGAAWGWRRVRGVAACGPW